MRIPLALLFVVGSVVPGVAETACEDDRAATRALVGIVATGREQAEVRLAQALQRIRVLEAEVRRLQPAPKER